jgi:NAD(P)-dependent dehydrogenase (short-subunit alcohol dehydrogenase family)
VKAIHLNLAEKDSIDKAIDECGGPIDVLLSCAGVAQDTPGVDKINFIGHRHMIERLVNEDILRRGAAIGMISSGAGLGWQGELPLLKEYLDTPDFESAVAWNEAHPMQSGYRWSKQAINAYVARQGYPFLKKGIRINAILPGPTDTPLAQANREMWLEFGKDYRSDTGIEAATPEDQAYPLVFLCSDAAGYITGATLEIDAGYMPAGLTGAYESAAPVAGFLYDKIAQIASGSIG